MRELKKVHDLPNPVFYNDTANAAAKKPAKAVNGPKDTPRLAAPGTLLLDEFELEAAGG
jgi:hypothetical protein